MRAALLSSYGPPNHLRVETVPDPTLERPNDVRIAVEAASINPIDWKIRQGLQRGAIRLTLPWIQGLDVAGTVVEVGPGVTRFSPGDAVMGCPDHRRSGSYAEQCVVDAASLVRKPDGATFAEAAALPLVGLTAWQCLEPRLTDKPGERILIQAGSGGVGHVAIQLAKAKGAWVVTTCSEANRTLVEDLGADQVVDYRTTRWWETLTDLDVVLDALGGEERERALAAVGRGGRVASIVSGLPANTKRYGPNLGTLATGLGIAGFWLRGRLRGVDASTVIKQNRTDHLQQLADRLGDGSLAVRIDRTYPLDDIAEAHTYGETGRIRGKVVIACGANAGER